MDDEPTSEPGQTKAVISECKFSRESFWRKALWQTFWLVLGAAVGYSLSTWRVHVTDQQQRIAKTQYWIASATDEIDYNVAWGTNSPSFEERGDSVVLKSRLRDSALRYFLDILPELHLSHLEAANAGRDLEHLIASFNQIVDQRNLVKNESFMALNRENHYATVREYERVLNGRLAQIKNHSADYKRLLTSVADSLKT